MPAGSKDIPGGRGGRGRGGCRSLHQSCVSLNKKLSIHLYPRKLPPRRYSWGRARTGEVRNTPSHTLLLIKGRNPPRQGITGYYTEGIVRTVCAEVSRWSCRALRPAPGGLNQTDPWSCTPSWACPWEHRSSSHQRQEWPGGGKEFHKWGLSPSVQLLANQGMWLHKLRHLGRSKWVYRLI